MNRFIGSRNEMYKDIKIEDFLNKLSSKSPTPGGGSAAAITGAMSASLAAMVCNLTIGKKKYEKVQTEVIKLNSLAVEYKKRLLELADEDSRAFENVIKQYKSKRTDKIQIALKHATEVPLETATITCKLEKTAKILIKKGNKNARSDAKTALYLARAGKLSALENVKINLLSITDKAWKEKIKKNVRRSYREPPLKLA